MKRWFSLFMLFGALLGLFGQTSVFANAGRLDRSIETVGGPQMSPDCAEMMGLAKQKPKPEKPCHGMTPDCIAKMGCAAAAALVPGSAIDLAADAVTGVTTQTSVVRLVGRSLTPEPEPPTFLG